MKYFKSKYQPKLTYPPEWFGEMTYPPKNQEVEVLLYHDQDCYLVARTESPLIVGCAKRGECELITEDEANILIGEALFHLKENSIGVYVQESLLPENLVEDHSITYKWEAKAAPPEPIPEALQDITLDDFKVIIGGQVT